MFFKKIKFLTSRLFTIVVICLSILFLIAYIINICPSNNFSLLIQTLSIYWLFFIFILGIVLFIIGFGRFFYEIFKKITNTKNLHFNSLIIKGFMYIVIAIFYFYIISFITGMFNCPISNLQLPQIPSVSPGLSPHASSVTPPPPATRTQDNGGVGAG
jgi:hypothetical protein